jgi:N-acetyl-anhydromuramyl-L-alanine amidase AmpD
MAVTDIPGQVATIGKLVLMTSAYALSLPNLIHMKQKPAAWVFPRYGTAIDEIVLHGTESNVSQVKSLDYLASKNGDQHAIHYWIGRDVGLLYALVPEDKSTPHAGNPDNVPGVTDHNFRSIGIEMYQWDPAVLRAKKLAVDFTDWQYNTVAQLVYDICRRQKIKRKMVVGHGMINPTQRADPQGFDWPRFNRLLDQISAQLGGLLGDDFKVN